jgi:hypothetical protein
MTVKSLLKSTLREINPTNLNKVMDTFSKGMAEFSTSMDKITRELGESKKDSTQDKMNVDKLLGKKKPLW